MLNLGNPGCRQVLCVDCTTDELRDLTRSLKNSDICLLPVSSPSDALAACVANSASLGAALVHGPSLRGEDYSVVKSLHLVRPGLPIILIDDRKIARNGRPEGIASVVGTGDEAALVSTLQQLAAGQSETSDVNC